MNRLLSLFVCLCLLFSFTGCGDKKKSNSNNIDLEYYAKLGQMPEAEYTLGTDVDKVIKELTAKFDDYQNSHGDDPDHSHDHNQADFMFEVIEGENNILIDNGTVNYYYNKKNKDNGISYIVNFDTAFDLEIGTVSSEVRKYLSDYDLKEEPLTDDNAFFVSYLTNGTVLKTEIEDVAILFVFEDNQLFATAIYDINNWNY